MSLFDFPNIVLVVVFGTSFLALEAGYRLARRTGVNDETHHHEQIISLRDGLLVLLSLLIGFTYSMAVSRFDLRRQLLIDEANAIGTTSLRPKTLPEPQQSAMAQLLRQYTDARVQFSSASVDTPEQVTALEQSKRIQGALWEQTVALSHQDRSPVFVAFMQSLNETIDLDAKRRAARENRIPQIIWFLITLIVAMASFTTGYSLHRRFWFPALMMPLMFAAAVFLIADLDTPTRGFIRAGQESLLRLQQDLAK